MNEMSGGQQLQDLDAYEGVQAWLAALLAWLDAIPTDSLHQAKHISAMCPLTKPAHQ